jgi:hypothetical protein
MLDFMEDEPGESWSALGEESNYIIRRVDRGGKAYDVIRNVTNGWDTTILMISFAHEYEGALQLAQRMEDKSLEAHRHSIRLKALRQAKRV